jgi:hypothetical protein
MLSEKESNTIAEKVANLLAGKKRAEWVDPETHAADHRFIRRLRDDEPRRSALLDAVELDQQRRKAKALAAGRIRERVVGSVLISVILSALGLLGYYFIEYLRAARHIMTQG